MAATMHSLSCSQHTHHVQRSREHSATKSWGLVAPLAWQEVAGTLAQYVNNHLPTARQIQALLRSEWLTAVGYVSSSEDAENRTRGSASNGKAKGRTRAGAGNSSEGRMEADDVQIHAEGLPVAGAKLEEEAGQSEDGGWRESAEECGRRVVQLLQVCLTAFEAESECTIGNDLHCLHSTCFTAMAAELS
jgi:hypothetical protein